MLYPKRSDYAPPRMATVALLFFSFSVTRGEASVTHGEAAPQPGVCSGVLTEAGGELAIVEEPEHICTFGEEAKRKILAVCTEGHYCEVDGILDDCKDTGECSEITNVISIRDLTIAQRQEQPPHVDLPAPSAPADLAALPKQLRVEIEGVTKTCNSPVSVLDNFFSYMQDGNYRFIVFHFEKIRCADLTAICRTRGCLHQIYVSRNTEPYVRIVSDYFLELELKHLDGAVAVEVTSTGGTRTRRWDGKGFY